MWKLLLFNCLLASVLTQSHAKDDDKTSSSIYNTESHEHDTDSDSGISESGLSDSVPAEKVTKVTVKKARSSKFPLQFAKRVTKNSDDEEGETGETVGKKVYKDVGFRKKKFEKALLKEKRKASTTNPNKKKKTTMITKRTKKPYERRVLENASDLNFPSGLFTDMPPLVAKARLGSKEIEIDKSRAGHIIADLKEKYRDKLISDDESNINERTDNPIFRPSNETGDLSHYDDSEYDDDDDEEHEEEEEDHEGDESSDKEDEKKNKGEREEKKYTGDTKKINKNATRTPTTSEEYDEDHETLLTTLTESGKEERAYKVLSKLKNATNIHVDTEERLNHKKIILDTLRRQGLSDSQEEILDIVSHYDSVTDKIFSRTRPLDLNSTRTSKKKSILHSIEQAYERALKDSKKNKTRNAVSESKEYSRPTFDKKPRSDASRERRKKEKKAKRQRQREEREKEKKKGDKEGSKSVSEEKRKPIKERPLIPKREDRPGYERRRYDSRERYRGRYEPRDRYRERYSRERYRGRYDSRARYGDRQRFDSRERYRERDRPRSRERYRQRYDSRERYRPRQAEERETRREGGEERRDYRAREPRGDDKRETRREGGEQRRDYRAEGGRPRYSVRRPIRDRMTRKKWYSEEAPDAKRVYAQPTERGAENRDKARDGYVRNVRNVGRSRMNKAAPTQDSFSREYHHFATNDEQNSAFKNFMKSKKLRDLEAMAGEELVTIP